MIQPHDRIFIVGMAAIAALVVAPFGHTGYGHGAFGKTYVNAAGHTVQRPVLAEEKPTGATGRCMDRYWTFSEKREGACQGHGGVWVWLTP